jgi:hypothetical protein
MASNPIINTPTSSTLKRDAPSTQATTPTSPIITPFGLARISLGTAALLFPHWTCSLFRFAAPASSLVVVRLFGVRDAILGEMLYTASDPTAPDGGRKELKRALWRNITADSVDMCSVGVAVATGALGRVPGAMLAGGAGIGVVMGVLGLRGL